MKKGIKLLSLSMLLLSVIATPTANVDTKKAQLLRANDNEDYRGQTLTIYNCSDYIDEELITEFMERYNCKVNYHTYDTNETMYNQFTLQPQGTYDLICTSDYMVQRMVRENLVIPIDIEKDCPVYNQYAASTLRGKLKDMKTDPDGDGVKDVNLDQYSAGYMWGTLGIVYDPFCSDTIREDVKSWDIFWNEKYKNLISIKNSMRDTFVVGLMHAYSGSEYTDVEPLAKTAREKFLSEMATATDKQKVRDEYNEVIQRLFDLVITQEDYHQTLKVVKDELISLKKNIFGLEVDSGKNDIITGKIKMNLAWSGDAVYSIDCALEEQGKVLEYYVPDDGSNVWYDSWSIPKGGNKELACKFIDFLSEPENAAQNMDYIGYTSFIACDEIFDLVTSWHGVSDYYDEQEYFAPYYDEKAEEDVDGDIVCYQGKFYQCIKDSTGNLPTNAEYFEELSEEDATFGEPYDLSYLFASNASEGKPLVIYPYEDCENRLFAQYPDEDTIARCGIMNDFEKANDDVVIMWGQVKAYTNMTPYYVVLIVTAAGIIGLILFKVISKKRSSRNKRRLESLK